MHVLVFSASVYALSISSALFICKMHVYLCVCVCEGVKDFEIPGIVDTSVYLAPGFQTVSARAV